MSHTGGLFHALLLINSVRDPLSALATTYAATAREDLLAWPRLDDVTLATKAFLDPVLAGDLDATWAPDRWDWKTTW